ncbi:MAG TPA: DNA polymerase I [Salinivirgaceae bacterium]|nr:DNA polymerase I [Salinivirgaceae bacterium]HQA75564.1 DNA polymerase I [Salinivirgaceae bacterium]
MNKKLFLIDAYALIYRSYFAFINNPRMTTTGINTSAIFGFTNTLLELIKTEKPDYLAIGFDLSQPTFRHEMYPEYKANRDETPEGVRVAVPYVKRLAQAMNIPIVAKPGYEADDVIGTIAKKASQEGFDVYMMTPDKDYGQLVEENIKMYKPKSFGTGFDVIGVNEICKKYGIKNPTQLIDILALWGDASDNIKGVDNVGEKTASKLIAEYESVEGIYQNINNLKGRTKENLLNSKDIVQMSKKLVTIVTDIDMEIDFDEMKVSPPNMQEIDELFNELEFRTLRQRFEQNIQPKQVHVQKTLWDNGSDDDKEMFNQLATHKTLQDIDHNYKLITEKEDLVQLVNTLKSFDTFSFDTETTNIDAIKAKIVGVSFCAVEGEAYYISTNEKLSDIEIVKEIRCLLEDDNKTIIGQNLKYDLLVLRGYDIKPTAKLIDTMLAHYLINSDQRHSIDFLALNYLNWQKITTDSLIGKKGSGQMNMAQLKPEQVCDYACEDADVAFRLWKKLSPELEKYELQIVFETVEMPLVKVLVEMEFIGVKINIEDLNTLRQQYQQESQDIENKIFEYAGYQFNIASPKQLGELLFARLKITDKPKLTKTKQYATGEEVLVELKDNHPIVGLILEYRELQKLLNTYIEALPKLVNPNSGRIHTSFNQAVTNTGRLSSANPNLQNIPIRDERGKAIRKAFVPANENHALISADYSQIELRIMAHLSQDKNMLEAFAKDMDIHQDTAAKLFGITPDEVTREQRGHAKGANFGIIYGISPFGLAKNTGLSQSEAKTLIDNYFNTYPGVKKYMDYSIDLAHEKGYVQTIMGRKRFLPEIRSANATVRKAAERNAINAPIQGSSADMIKLAMIDIYNEFTKENLKSKMILQVHDELVFDVPTDEIEIVKKIVEDKMLNAMKLKVKLKVDVNVANNWLDAH